MENHEKNIDDLFRDALGDYTEEPPPAVWKNLESKLNNTSGGDSFKNYRTFGMASLLLMFGLRTRRLFNGMPGADNSGELKKAPGNLVRRYFAYGIIGLLLVLSIPLVRHFTGHHSPAAEEGGKAKTLSATIAVNEPVGIREHAVTTTHATEHIYVENAGGQIPVIEGAKPDAAKHGKQGPTGTEIKSDKSESGKSAAADRLRNKTAHQSKVANKQNPTGGTYTGNETARQEQDDQSGNVSNPAPAERVAAEAAETNIKKGTETKAPVNKKEQDIVNNIQNKNKPKKETKPEFRKLEAGVKMGYEGGFDNDGGKKAVISPFIQYSLSPKFSLMTQPAMKYSSLATMRIGNTQTYYRQNSDSTVVPIGASSPVYLEGGAVIIGYVTPFRYHQTHDSIIKSNVIGGKYSEFEIPFLLKYKIGKTVSVYGGVNIVYSKTIVIHENTVTYPHISRQLDSFEFSPWFNAAPIPTSYAITYSGNEISRYHGPQYPTTTSEEWRLGYMIGFSYEFYRRWLFDALIQQSNSKANYQGGYNINTALSLPYFRLTLGYKLIK